MIFDETDPTIGKWYWHIHHGELVEKADEPIDYRIAYINTEKDESEIPLRLRLLHQVSDDLAAKLEELWGIKQKHNASYEDWWSRPLGIFRRSIIDRVYDRYRKSVKAFNDFVNSEDFQEAHKAECPNCPWDNRGQTIFTNLDANGTWI